MIKDSQGMDCYIYAPDSIDPNKTYQLIVGVHGVGGSGKTEGRIKGWVSRGDVIVMGPSFISKSNGTQTSYQSGDGIHAKKLIELFETMKKTYKLRDQMFLHGFSGGSQFAHRFTMLNPKLVCGCSCHSGGSWATDNYGKINSAAKNIPFAISCGEKDTGKSFGSAPYTRLDWYKRFKDEIDKKKFCYIGGTWPNVGHSMSAGAWDLTRQCFQIATGLPGQSATEPVTISSEWKNLESKQKATPLASTAKQTPNTPSINIAELDKIFLAAFKKADSEKVPDKLLIGFMKKYPPALWKEKPGSTKLMEQCKTAANNLYTTTKENGMWTESAKQQFAKFTDGLDLKTD